MEAARHQLLARSAFPRDEHRRGGRRRQIDHPVELLHGLAFSHQASGPPDRLELAPEQRDLAERLALLERLLDQDPQARQVHRFGEVVVGSLLHRRDRRLDGGMSGEKNHRRQRRFRAELRQQSQAVQPRHQHVCHHDPRKKGRRFFQRLLPVGRLLDLVSPVGEQRLQPLPGSLFIVGNQHPISHRISFRAT